MVFEAAMPGVRRFGPLALCLLVSLPLAADETRRYDWITSGRVTGSHVMTIKDDGTRVSDFEFNDRGRGPKIHEIVGFDADGRVNRLDISGHAYMGAQVDEHFKREEGQASWRSTLESDSRSNPGDAIYLAADGTPEQTAQLARALLASPDHSLPILPQGRARIEKADQLTIGPADGEQQVSLYAISGLGLSPSYLWLDANLELFSSGASWMGLVPEGWAEYFPALADRQNEVEARYFETRAADLTRQLPAEYVFENVAVVDVENARILKNRLVVVRDGLIATMGHKLPEDFRGETIDGRGGYLAPGLWDMHTHMGLQEGMQHIAGGVTTVRDLGNNPGELLPIREKIEAGRVIGPAIHPAGFIDRKSPYSAPIETLAESLEDALKLVRYYAELDYRQIKIYSSMDPAWIAPIAAEAHAHGMRLSGHVPNGTNATTAVRQGFDEIQHINMLFLNFLAGPDDDTRTPVRFTLVGEKAASVDLESAEVEEFVALLKQHNTVVDPTVAIFEGMFTHIPGQVNPSFAMVADHFPPSVQRGLLSSRMISEAAEAEQYADDAQALLDMIRLLHENGIRLVAGTDGMPGFLLHRELELYVKAGIPAADVMHLATLGSAEVLGIAAETGSIAPGKRADLVLLENNPLEDINAIRRARLVIRGQRAWKPAELHRSMGIVPFVSD